MGSLIRQVKGRFWCSNIQPNLAIAYFYSPGGSTDQRFHVLQNCLGPSNRLKGCTWNYCPPQWHLADSRSEEGSSGCWNVNNGVDIKVVFWLIRCLFRVLLRPMMLLLRLMVMMIMMMKLVWCSARRRAARRKLKQLKGGAGNSADDLDLDDDNDDELGTSILLCCNEANRKTVKSN